MIAENEKIHISWAHHGQIDNYFAISLLDVVSGFPNIIGSYNSIKGTGLLAKSRNLMISHFLDKTKEDWILIIDSDEFLSIDAFAKLASEIDKDTCPVLSAVVFSMGSDVRMEPFPCIFKLENGVNIIYQDYPENQILDIDAAGSGCLLIHRSVLEKVRELYKEQTGPTWAWYGDGPIGIDDVWLSEDITFSYRIREAGYQMKAHTGAIIPHHKEIWLTDEQYKEYRKSSKK
jgi:cellulose synthase/poly-beta-1,6-N-acetylglucosamine synthase-like glycosyltransferase